MENLVDINKFRENLLKNYPVAKEEDFEFEVIDAGVRITKYKGNFETLIIPEKINGKDVVEIGSSFLKRRNKKIKNIIIPDTVKNINNHAFDSSKFNSVLEYIHLPDSIITIGYSAFLDCRKLNRIIIPESVTTIESCAFSGCFYLNNINIPEGVTVIGGSAFPRNCDMDISENNKNYSFINGFLLDKTGETLIGCYTYQRYKEYGNVEIDIPEGVLTINDFAFSDHRLIEKINIPESVTFIGNNVFNSIFDITGRFHDTHYSSLFPALSNINVSNDNKNYKSIDGVLFDKNCETLIRYPCAKKGPYKIPENIKTIAAGAFMYCEGLTTVKIPESVKVIGESAFAHCLYLNSIKIPENVETIESQAFYNCRRLTSINLHKNISLIGSSAFYRNTSLKNINIPENHTYIEEGAFNECYRLPKKFFKTIKENFGEDRINRSPGPHSIFYEVLPIVCIGVIFLMSFWLFLHFFTENKMGLLIHEYLEVFFTFVLLGLAILGLIEYFIKQHKYKYDPSYET